MPNHNRQIPVPADPYERAIWLDERLPQLLRRVPLHSGFSGVADIERTFFPRRNILPLDPTCPICGVETDDGRVDRNPETEIYTVHYDCGHVLELTAQELEGRLRARQP